MNEIKEFRTKHKLTQKEMAKLLEKSERQIINLERGHSKITSDTFFRLKHIDEDEKKT